MKVKFIVKNYAGYEIDTVEANGDDEQDALYNCLIHNNLMLADGDTITIEILEY